MSAPGGTATIGLQVILNDVAASGLAALGLGFIGLSKSVSGLNTLLVEGGPTLAMWGATAVASAGMFALFAGALAYTIDQGKGLQDALVTVENAVQGASQNVQGITQDIITLGNTSIFSSQQLADGFATMGEYGQNATDIIKYTGQAMVTLAEAINVGTVPAAQILTNTMQLFGASASQANEYVKALTFGFYNGEPNVASFADALNQAGPMAHQLGVNIDDLVTYIDILAQDGLKGAEAGTALRYALSGIVTPSNQAITQLANLGIVIVNQTTPALQSVINGLEQAGGVAGKEAARYNGTIASLQAIYTWGTKLGQIPTNQTFYQWLLATGQITDKLYNDQGKFIGISDAINMIGNAIKGLPEAQKIAVLQQIFSIQGGTGMLQLVNNLQKTNDQYTKLTKNLANTNPIQDAQRVIGTLSGQLKALGTSIQDAAAVIGLQIIPVITQIVGGVNHLVGVFAKAPPAIHQFAAIFLIVGVAITGVTLVVSAAVLAFAFLATTAGGAVLAVGGIMAGLAAAILLVAGVIILLKTHWQQVQPFLAPAGQAFQQIGQIVKSQLIPAFVQMEPALKIIGIVLGVILVAAIILFISVVVGIVQALAKVLVGVVLFGTGLVKVISGALQTVMALVGGVLAILGDIFHGNWSKIGMDAQNMLNGMAKGIGTIFSGLKNMLQGLITATVGMALALFGGMIGSLIAIVGRIIPGVQGFPGKIVDLFKGIPGQLASIGRDIISGLVNAILNGIGPVGGAMRNLAGNMLGQLKGVLGIHSPSTVMMELGTHTATGFLQGITGTNVAGPAAAHLSGVVGATKSALSGSISSASRGLGGGGGGQGGSTTLQFMLDSKVVATAVVDNLTGQLKMNGAARKGQ